MKRYQTEALPATETAGGSYLLVLAVKRRITVHVGTLGGPALAAGTYLYVGSAKRGITQRIRRHLARSTRRGGPKHWHIDHLLTSPHVGIIAAIAYPGADECDISLALASLAEIDVGVRRFGASDCKRSCPAHLYRLKRSARIRPREAARWIAEELGKDAMGGASPYIAHLHY